MRGDPLTNVGDIVTPYLLQKWAKQPVRHWTNFKPSQVRVLYGAGSFLNPTTTGRKNVTVWGSGVISKNTKLKSVGKILAVRGPLTREAFLRNRVPCPAVYGDPALCLPLVFPKPSVAQRFLVGIVPHFVDEIDVSQATLAGVKIISVRLGVEEFVRSLCECKAIVSSSLHGFIIAQAYGIPAVPVKLSNRLSGDGTKFRDYQLSVGVPDVGPVVVSLSDQTPESLFELASKAAQPSNTLRQGEKLRELARCYLRRR